MKVLIVEDDEKSLTQLLQAVTETIGPRTDVTCIKTARGLPEVMRDIKRKKFALVLTDMYLRVGEYNGYGPQNLAEDALVAAGLSVVTVALASNVPCVLCTDSDGHHDLLGGLLERAQVGIWIERQRKGCPMLICQTRPPIEAGTKQWHLHIWLQDFLKARRAKK